MEILPGIEIKGKSLWIKKQKILIIADLHIGYEEALVSRGVLLPKQVFPELKKEIQELLKLGPKLILINGDLKHEFGKISRQEWQDALEILDLMLKQSKIILIRGNHDFILEPIARKRGIEVQDFYCFENICVLHGDKIFLDCLDKHVKALIIGHDHPAISINDGLKREKFKCFLLGKYKDKKLVVMPSFFSLVEGSDVGHEKLFSPFINNKKDFRVFVVGDRAYDFGKLKDL